MTGFHIPSLGSSIEALMYGLSQLFLYPVLTAIPLLFLYAFFALGAFAWQRRRGTAAAFELLEVARATPRLTVAELEAEAITRLEFVRIATRIAPLLSPINLIDVFLVLVAALLLAMGTSPMNPFADERATWIRNPGQPDMEVIVKDGRRIERFTADGAAGAGKGVRAGVAYRMADGSLIDVPE